MEPQVIYLFYYCLCIAMCRTEAIESPTYTVETSESDFEIRLYSESSWISAPVRGTSFTHSTKDGFHRLYEYIHGGNLESSKLGFTAPVLTSIPSSTSSHGNYDYVVRFYVSTKYEGKPPQPNPELKLQLDKWRSHCIAVRSFSGFAYDDNINKEVEALINGLSKYYGSSDAIQDKGSYSIAQYNSSRHLSGRFNEVWINVSGPNSQGCPLSQ